VLVAAERPAYGYTDPGTGALLWQMLLAAFVGLGFYFRRIVAWMKHRKRASNIENAPR
jgi:hypothetical protein